MKEILCQFNIKEPITSIIESKIGLINNTYIVNGRDKRYILQKINTSIFTNPKALMQNIELITSYLKKMQHKSLDIVKSKEGSLYVIDKNSFWRVFKYIESRTLEHVDNFRIVSESAYQLARFHRDLNKFPISSLHNTIPNFHNTEKILTRFQDLLLNTKKELLDQCDEQIHYILSKKQDCSILQKLIVENKIPLRICHNDPKISNFLFDDKFNVICLIDLDTVMLGTVLTDIGDAIRTICVSRNENESNLNQLYFRSDYFKHFLNSYFKVNKTNLNSYEINNIVKSIELIFLEQGIRFLTDYLTDNTYFKVSYKRQNLVRAKNQLFFAKKVADNEEKLNLIVNQCVI